MSSGKWEVAPTRSTPGNAASCASQSATASARYSVGDLKCKQVARFEARPYLLDFGKRARSERRAGHQHETQRNLADYEGRAGAPV